MTRQLVLGGGGAPEFRIFSQTIHMTGYSKAEFESEAAVQLIYFHEYTHLLQAVTTRGSALRTSESWRVAIETGFQG